MLRVIENITRRPAFSHAPGVQDGQPVTGLGNDAQVMGDENDRKFHLFLQVTQQAQDLRLDGHVQGGISLDKTGIFLSKPIALLLVLIYLLQSTLLVFMIKDKYELHKIIDYQRQRLAEMEEKLRIFQVIEDFQIGFTDDEKKELANVIFEESNKYNYDPMLIMAVILTESSFKKGQVSHVGARGVMQVMPNIGHDLAQRSGIDWEGSEQLFDPATNVRLGTLYLFEQILKFKDVRKGIIAYNLGETRLRGRLKENKPLPKQYFRKIWENYNMLKEKYDT